MGQSVIEAEHEQSTHQQTSDYVFIGILKSLLGDQGKGCMMFDRLCRSKPKKVRYETCSVVTLNPKLGETALKIVK